jgi:hypothetical protein
MIESRGRTGRKPTVAEKGTSAKGGARGSTSRKNRYDSPPTWKGSAVRAVIAAAIVYALSTVLLGKGSDAVANLILVPVVLALYTPMIYYTDMFMYRRRLKRKAAS